MDSFFEIFGMYRYPRTVASEPMKESEPIEDVLPVGLNPSDESLWFTHEFWDETSQFDDHPTKRWCGEAWERKYQIRVPRAFRLSDGMVRKWVEFALDNWPCNSQLYPDQESEATNE